MNSLPRINQEQTKKTACSTMYNWVFRNVFRVFRLDTILNGTYKKQQMGAR